MEELKQGCLFVIMCMLISFVGSAEPGTRSVPRVPISVVSGVYWREIEVAEMYEASIPLVYKAMWPNVDAAYIKRTDGEGFCNGTVNNPECMLYSWVEQVNKETGARLTWLNRTLAETAENFVSVSGKREKRSLKFLGNFAHWCCGVITGRQLRPLYTNQERMNSFEQQLQGELQEAYSEIDNLTLNMDSYSAEVARTFAQVIDVGVNITKMMDLFRSRVYAADQKVSNKVHSLLQLDAMQVVRQLQTLQLVMRLEILSQCREKKLPNSIIPMSKFKSDLVKLADAIRSDDYELAISPEEITKYLKLEIADCMISGSHIVVNVKIPIRKMGSQWQLFELISVPFAWKNFTCNIQHGVTFLAVDRDRLVTIQGAAAHDCQPYENPLCYVPRYAGDAVSGSLCPRAMFLGATIQELSALCAFSCVPSRMPVVSKVEEDSYILTHISGDLELQCRHGPNQTLSVPGENRPGALQVKVACDCRLLVNNQVVVSESYPCYKRISVSEVIHIVPASWSKLRSLKVPSRSTYFSSSFDTLDECLDENWPTVVPHWNLSYTTTHRSSISPPLIVQAQSEQAWLSMSLIIHCIYFSLVTIIVLRNPHLLGFQVFNVARANPVEIYVTEQTRSEAICISILTVVSVVCWWVVRKVCHRCKSKQGGEEVAMTGRQGPRDNDGLPNGMALAEIDGRELRITLEWWDQKDPLPGDQ